MTKKNTFITSIKLIVLGLSFIGIFSSCGKEVQKPRPDDFTFEVRENLGDILSDAILNNSEDFEILDRTTYSTNVYKYLDSIMVQVANQYHFNNSDSGWNQDREWEANVIHDDTEKFAFCVPGGNFYISTGFLKDIENDYELYYVMAFELTIMQNEFLLNKLYSLGIENIAAISEGIVEPGELSADSVVLNFLDPAFGYDETMVAEIDLLTLNYICETSDWNRFGIVNIIENSPQMDGLWFASRPSYSGRENLNVAQIPIDNESDCGNKFEADEIDKRYETQVLPFLP